MNAGPAPASLNIQERRLMSASDQTSNSAPSSNWIANQPYLLLSITALCWAGNAIVGRLAAGHIPPVTPSFLRWSFSFLLLQSAAPLVVALWSLAILGIRLTVAQAFGVALSMCGVLIILLHGDITTLSNIAFNKGDLIFIVALIIFALYSVLTLKRPPIHGLSFLAFTFGAGAACLIPLEIWELSARPVMKLDGPNLLTLFYVSVFPSTLAYLCCNRGV